MGVGQNSKNTKNTQAVTNNKKEIDLENIIKDIDDAKNFIVDKAENKISKNIKNEYVFAAESFIDHLEINKNLADFFEINKDNISELKSLFKEYNLLDKELGFTTEGIKALKDKNFNEKEVSQDLVDLKSLIGKIVDTKHKENELLDKIIKKDGEDLDKKEYSELLNNLYNLEKDLLDYSETLQSYNSYNDIHEKVLNQIHEKDNIKINRIDSYKNLEK